MTADETAVGQVVDVVWKRSLLPTRMTIVELHPLRPCLVTVRYRDGEHAVAHVNQLTLVSEVPA